jgi:hypothetical protein
MSCGLGCVAGCLSERPRPAPPQLAIVLARTVRSPDTLRGTIHAEDPDGIDSVWLTVGSAPRLGQDGLLETVFDAPFVVVIPRGLSPGDRIPVVVVGFMGELDTLVTVSP